MENSILKIFGSMDVKITLNFFFEIDHDFIGSEALSGMIMKN